MKYVIIFLFCFVLVRDETLAEDLIEKQAEMIRYLQEHNQQLAKRVLALTNTDSA